MIKHFSRTLPSPVASQRAVETGTVTSVIGFPPGAPMEHWRQLIPASLPAVYVLSDVDGIVLYVGQTIKPGPRLRSHYRLQDWWPEVARIELHLVPDQMHGRLLELDLTERLQPRHGGVTAVERLLLARLVAGVQA